MENFFKHTQWSLFANFLINRTKKSWENPKYVMYFIFIIFLVGSFGLLYELTTFEYCLCDFDSGKVKSITFNMTNISLSLITASVIDLIFISQDNIEEDKQKGKVNKAENELIKGNVRFFGLISLILSFIFWILVNNILVNNYYKLLFGTISLFFSYWIWWISNVKNKILSEGMEGMEGLINTIGGPINPSNPPSNPPSFESSVKDAIKNNLGGSIATYKS